MSSEMALAIRQIIQERGISEELVMHTIEDALLAAYKRKYGTIDNAVVRFAEDATSVSIFAQKKIVPDQEIEDPALEISLSDAQAYNTDTDDEAEVGDELLIRINPRDFDRVSIQSAKQKTRQSLREIQKDTLYSEFKDREGELIVGYYQRERNGTIFVDVGRTEGILPRRYQSPREIYRPNDRVRAMIYEVEKAALGLQIVLTRTHTEFVKKIFELEVPEIYDRTIEIHKMVREPGYRTKMSVYSTRDDVDPVGACVGMRGVRIQTVVRAMIYEVEKAALGLQIVLTRTHTEFVKKIFELEVPEIYDRTIEIHKMVREPGYRTKMSVYSTRDDVDPVGACVGMRGVRIQTVVRELEGEKIDVLRYDPDVRSFITEALKPAEVEQVIVLDEAKRQALAVVPESQFSLAIGKQGLNVRLANRLTDWSIDVRTRAQVNEMNIGADPRRAAAALFGDVQEEITDVAELPGIAPRVAAALKASGVELLETLVAMDEEQLRAVPELSEQDVGELRKLIEENLEIVEEEPPTADAEPADAEPADAEPAPAAAPAAPAVEETVAHAVAEEAPPEGAAEEPEVVRASELPGLPEGIGAALMAAGLDDVVELVSMSDEQIGAVEGLSDDDVKTLLRVIEENVEVVEEDDEDPDTPQEAGQ